MKNTLVQPLAARTQKPVSASPGLPFSLSAFNPALPEDGALILAEVLREQFIALQTETLARATTEQLNAAVAALEAEIAQRATQADLDAEVATLEASIAECATYPWVVNAVNTGSDNAVATTLPQTSANSNGVAIFDQAVPSYYDTYFTQGLVDKLNELINALRR